MEAEGQDELNIFNNIRSLGLHKVVTHAKNFPCANAILLIIRHIKLSKRYILNAKGKIITSFRAYDIVLDLDQVLGDPWSSLTYFGTSMACRRRSTRRSRDHGISAPFWVFFWDLGICNGNGMLAHGFTHV
jgi:hypothetical protein